MKICFRTNAERGGEQSPRQDCSANPTSRKSPWAPKRLVSVRMPPGENPSNHSLRRGTGTCAVFASPCPEHLRTGMSSRGCARCNAADQHPSLAQAIKTSALARPADRVIAVISNRELLVLEISQLIENTRRPLVLIENFEPNSAPVFPAFVAAAFLPRGTKGRRAALSLLDFPCKRLNAQGAF
jgi:hypothetical protein